MTCLLLQASLAWPMALVPSSSSAARKKYTLPRVLSQYIFSMRKIEEPGIETWRKQWIKAIIYFTATGEDTDQAVTYTFVASLEIFDKGNSGSSDSAEAPWPSWLIMPQRPGTTCMGCFVCTNLLTCLSGSWEMSFWGTSVGTWMNCNQGMCLPSWPLKVSEEPGQMPAWCTR